LNKAWIFARDQLAMNDVWVVPTEAWGAVAPSFGPNQRVVAPPAPWNEARVGKCYWNVLQMIGRHGGQAVYGWALTDFGPHRLHGRRDLPPLYRRWLNHVLWRDQQGQVWEVSPNMRIDQPGQTEFRPTEFLLDPDVTFEIVCEDNWQTRPCRYVPLRPEGVLVAELLTKAQHAVGDQVRNEWLGRALSALQLAGFRPREWKVETIGDRTGSISLIAE